MGASDRAKAVLVRLGFSHTCKGCGKKEFHFGRFVSDITLYVMLITVSVVYLTQEKPYIECVNNCTFVWNKMMMDRVDFNLTYYNRTSYLKLPTNYTTITVPDGHP